MKDYFSQHASIYVAFRPSYPASLYQFVLEKLSVTEKAWDCATGNGQVALELSKYFDVVEATDISQQQLDHAHLAENIRYRLSLAEQTPFPDNSFDLITVGQALHWFDTPRFFAEAKRVGKPGACLAIWGYSFLTVNTEIDTRFLYYYNNIVGPYWDSARKHIEEEYSTLHFPFEKIETEHFSLEVEWSFEQFIGYLRSWSATQKFIKEKNTDPLIDFSATLQEVWSPSQKMKVTFPIFLKVCAL